MCYDLKDFFEMVRDHHRLPVNRREADLLGRLASLCRAAPMSDDSRRALCLFIARHTS